MMAREQKGRYSCLIITTTNAKKTFHLEFYPAFRSRELLHMANLSPSEWLWNWQCLVPGLFHTHQSKAAGQIREQQFLLLHSSTVFEAYSFLGPERGKC